MVHVSRRTATIIAIGALALLGSAPVLLSQQVDPETVRLRLHAYLSAYEKELGTLVAEERLQQWPLRTSFSNVESSRRRRDSSRVRTIVSEVAFISLPGAAGWLGYRDVKTLGGKPIRRVGAPLEQLLRAQSDDVHERAKMLLLESARHNLGAPRTINLPSLPLELLHIRNQARFVIATSSIDRVGDCQAMRLDLTETVTPTIIQRPRGGNMPSRVAAWVEPQSGQLCRAEVRIRDAQIGVNQIEAVVRVDFALDPALKLLVPSRMTEEFLDPPRGRGEGEATYSNYRRFTTSARLLPPQAPGGPGPR